MESERSKSIWVKESSGQWRPLLKGETLPLSRGQEFAVGEALESATIYQFQQEADHQAFFKVFESNGPKSSEPSPHGPRLQKQSAVSFYFSDHPIPMEVGELRIFLGYNEESGKAEPGRALVSIADFLYDENPVQALTLKRNEKGAWQILPLDKFQQVPLQVVRPQGEGAITLLKVGTSVNLYDPQAPPFRLELGDEIIVGQQGIKFIFKKSEQGEARLAPEDAATEIHLSF